VLYDMSDNALARFRGQLNCGAGARRIAAARAGLAPMLFTWAVSRMKSPLAPLWQRGVGGICSDALVSARGYVNSIGARPQPHRFDTWRLHPPCRVGTRNRPTVFRVGHQTAVASGPEPAGGYPSAVLGAPSLSEYPLDGGETVVYTQTL
jgi:hypothetical protein